VKEITDQETEKLDLGEVKEITNQGAVMVAISNKKLDLGEVDKIFDQGAQLMAIKNNE
jgi:hypothetical protein